MVIWPVSFKVNGNNLGSVYGELGSASLRVRSFLQQAIMADDEITLSTQVLTDKSPQAWGDAQHAEFRYVATRTVTVYSWQVETVHVVMGGLVELGKEGVALTGDAYQNPVEYLFTRLNEVKPGMIKEATRNAREVASKFAEDADSRLGRIRQA